MSKNPLATVKESKTIEALKTARDLTVALAPTAIVIAATVIVVKKMTEDK
jgi:hypothetical protein